MLPYVCPEPVLATMILFILKKVVGRNINSMHLRLEQRVLVHAAGVGWPRRCQIGGLLDAAAGRLELYTETERQNAPLFRFPAVCPEPVLANPSFSNGNVRERSRFSRLPTACGVRAAPEVCDPAIREVASGPYAAGGATRSGTTLRP